MKLVWFEIEGFRRFSVRSKVNFDTKVVAVENGGAKIDHSAAV